MSLPTLQDYPPAGGCPPPVSQKAMSGGQRLIAEGDWMSLPASLPMDCPLGLGYLTTIDQLLVHQMVELLEVLTGFETKNKFTVKNSRGQKVFYAVEQSDCCTRNWYGFCHPFGMKIMDKYGNEVIHLERPLPCESCCYPRYRQKMEVYSPPGYLVGTVEEEWSICASAFSIKNAAGDVVLRIKGPVLTCIRGGNVDFNVISNDGSTTVGRISKQWSGLLREAFTDADYFGITFPMDLDVRMKAVMLGACFLIDVMFYEDR